jgi:hypothetical protein
MTSIHETMPALRVDFAALIIWVFGTLPVNGDTAGRLAL